MSIQNIRFEIALLGRKCSHVVYVVSRINTVSFGNSKCKHNFDYKKALQGNVNT